MHAYFIDVCQTADRWGTLTQGEVKKKGRKKEAEEEDTGAAKVVRGQVAEDYASVGSKHISVQNFFMYVFLSQLLVFANHLTGSTEKNRHQKLTSATSASDVLVNFACSWLGDTSRL